MLRKAVLALSPAQGSRFWLDGVDWPANANRLLLLLLVSVWVGLGLVPCGHADEIPVEAFFQRPTYGAILLSPNGQYLAVVVPFKGRNNLKVVDLQKHQAILVTNFDTSDVLQFRWINNNRLVLATGDAEEAAAVARYYGWYAVDWDGSSWVQLGFFVYLDLAPDGGDDIIVAARWRSANITDVYRLNTKTRSHHLLSFDSPGDVLNWLVDHNGVPRVAHSYVKGIHSLWYRESDGSPWIKIDEGTDIGLHFTPLAFGYDNKTLYVSATRNGDKRAIYTYDFQARKLGDMVAGSAQVDLGPLMFNRARNALVGIRYEGDKPGVVWLDADMERLQKTVDHALPDSFNRLNVSDEDLHRAVVLLLFRRGSWDDLFARHRQADAGGNCQNPAVDQPQADGDKKARSLHRPRRP